MREIKVNERAGIRDIERHKTQPNSSNAVIFVMYKQRKWNQIIPQNGKTSILSSKLVKNYIKQSYWIFISIGELLK